MMKTGIELIEQEREEQLNKHGRSVELDVTYNDDNQLARAAVRLIEDDWCIGIQKSPPEGWHPKIWDHMIKKSYKDRLIIAGALIAAEIDRLNHEE